MNRQMIVGISGAFLAGVGVGAAIVRTWIEKDLRAHPVEKIVFVQNNFKAETPVDAEEELAEEPKDHLSKVMSSSITEIKDSMTGETVMVLPNEKIESEDLGSDNPYHKAVTATETSVEVFVDGGINDYGMSYIEEEDYLDEDGRFKGKIDIMMDEHNPIFIMDGQQIDDWDRRVGDSILVDFYKLVPPGADEVLYVRNHRTDEDYEVVRVMQ